MNISVEDDAKRGKNDLVISFYTRPPMEEITIEEAEDFAVSRQALLGSIAMLSGRNLSKEEKIAEIEKLVKMFVMRHVRL